MRKQKSIGNKGFSLVELIIVIAIMAILVGVLAPNLLKYVEKTNVSADTQLADSVKTAVTTAMLDPSVISATDGSATAFSAEADGKWVSIGEEELTGSFWEAVAETLGSTATTSSGLKKELIGKLKSAHAENADIQVKIVGSNSVMVRITTTDSTAKKNTTSGTPITVGGDADATPSST